MNLGAIITTYDLLKDDWSDEENPFLIAGRHKVKTGRNETDFYLDDLSYSDLWEMRAANTNGTKRANPATSFRQQDLSDDAREQIIDGSNGESRAPPTQHPSNPDCLIHGGSWGDVETLFTDFRTILSEPKRKNESDWIGKTTFEGTQLVSKLIKHLASSQKTAQHFYRANSLEESVAIRRSNPTVFSSLTSIRVRNSAPFVSGYWTQVFLRSSTPPSVI